MTETEEPSADISSYRHFRVGDWLVESDEGRLSRGDESARVEPKAMEVLVYLAGRRGEVVTREELEREVWRGAMVGYDAVTSTVIKLRKALGDSARQPTVIRTIPKRGYQLIAKVSLVKTDSQEAPKEEDVLDNRPGTRLGVFSALALVAVAIISALFFLHREPEKVQPPASKVEVVATAPPSIIVLPFETLSDDPAQELFADGITEDIITDLSGLSNLMVFSSNTSFSYKGKMVTPEEVGNNLNVQFVLEGSIRRHQESVRVNAQLVDTKTGYQKWAERYDRRIDEVFAVQDEVTNSIVEALAIGITNQEKQRLSKRTTNSLEAYDYFREGQRLSRISSKDSNIEAQQLYRSAINADPNFGRAYGALAYIMAFNYRRGWSDSPVQVIDQALELAKKGVELDSSIPQTYWSLGFVYLMRKEYDEADAAVSEALSISPNYADGYGLLALIKNALGESEEAIALIKKGMKLNPYYTWDYPYNMGRAYYTLGKYDLAIVNLEAARTRNENAVPVRLHLAASYAASGRQDDAEWEIEEIQILSPTDTISQMRAAHPIKDPNLMDTFINDLRAAGLPE